MQSNKDYKKTLRYFNSLMKVNPETVYQKYGESGVAALSSATPVNTGKTADSWSYKINNDKNSVSISFSNSNVNDGVNVAIVLQYGHATKNGSYVEGIDYINPALKSIFEKMANDLWKEVTRL